MDELVIVSLDGEPFDISFVMQPNRFLVVVSLKLNFSFVKGPAGEWTLKEQVNYLYQWVSLVAGHWNKPWLTVTQKGRMVKPGMVVGLEFRVDTLATPNTAHWTVEVVKDSLEKPGGRSEVDWNDHTATFHATDIESETDRRTGRRYLVCLHEFGHFLEIDDEYGRRSRFRRDTNSIMNRGDAIRARHYAKFKRFADEVLRRYNQIDSPIQVPTRPGTAAPSTPVAVGPRIWSPHRGLLA